MASMTCSPTEARSSSASPTIPPPSPLIRSRAGGNTRAAPITIALASCSSWPTPAAAIAVVPVHGKQNFNPNFATGFGLTVTVAHYPTGASKCIPIEQRLFSEISKNCAAKPLDSYPKILNFIRHTGTRTGLVVSAYLDRKRYPTGSSPTLTQIRQLCIKRNPTLPAWNYTIAPM
jgi:hypothetical protein